ncbi:thioredoxin family protein [Halomarina litorea]|uniref:thioredoxin family protein n=1 Tax=Halomarina litorea TaxID=2961595 RepID=UPI0020C2D90B|nr:thioredoxin family protein [Halomarina sp. BCD28]
MTEADDELDAIREEKRKRLVEAQSVASSPAEPIHVDGADHLAELVGQHDVVLVDYYADWCGPCKMLEPTVESLAADSAAAVLKVDIDANQALAQQQGVRGVPTLQLYAGGELVERLVGVQDEGTLRSLVDQHA